MPAGGGRGPVAILGVALADPPQVALTLGQVRGPPPRGGLPCWDPGGERLRSGADLGCRFDSPPPSRSDLGASRVLPTQGEGTAAAQEARPRPLAAITPGQAAQS